MTVHSWEEITYLSWNKVLLVVKFLLVLLIIVLSLQVIISFYLLLIDTRLLSNEDGESRVELAIFTRLNFFRIRMFFVSRN